MPPVPIMPAQWCLPSARQHAGTDAVLPCASGASKAVSRTSKTIMDAPRFTVNASLAHHRNLIADNPPPFRGILKRAATLRSVTHIGRMEGILRHILVLLAIAGMVVSVLALRVHYSTESAPCSINEKWDCGIVNHSPYAEIRGLPVAAIGIAGYLLIAVLAWLRRRGLLLVAVMLGMAFALYLTNIEAKVLGVWCVYCVFSQGIIAALLLLTIGWVVWHVMRTRMA